MTCLSTPPTSSCVLKVTLVPSGMGLEVDQTDGCNIYSIGNQMVDANISITGGCCAETVPRLNGLAPPISVCDGDSIAVTIIPGASCTPMLAGTLCGQTGIMMARFFLKPSQNGFIVNKDAVKKYILSQSKRNIR